MPRPVGETGYRYPRWASSLPVQHDQGRDLPCASVSRQVQLSHILVHDLACRSKRKGHDAW